MSLVVNDLQTFYERTYPRLVGQISVLTGSRPEAEELVQDAFVRLIPRWEQVRDYDDPEAWVRTAASRRAVSSWRRKVVARAALPRLTGRESSEPSDGSDVDVSRALAALPRVQRQVVVMHHLWDQPLELIASQLNVPLGTVKSRLSRGRASLAVNLSEEVRHD